MKLTAEAVFEKAVSYMGLKASDGDLTAAASMLEAESADAVSAAIVYSNDANLKICGKPIIPCGVTDTDTKIEVADPVAETILPLKTAVILAARYDTELSAYLDRMCESFRNDLIKCRKASSHPISEAYE